MNDFTHARKAAESAADATAANLRRGAVVAEDTTKAFQDAFSVSTNGAREYHLKIIDLAQANSEAAFDLGRHLLRAQTPSEILQLWTEYLRTQLESLTQQTQHLADLGQRIATQSSEPVARNVKENLGAR